MKGFRILLGVVSCIPLLANVAFVVLVAGFFARAFQWVPDRTGAAIMSGGIVMFLVATAVALPCLIGYLVYVVSLTLSSQTKALWIVALVLGNGVAFPFAWFFLVWRRATELGA